LSTVAACSLFQLLTLIGRPIQASEPTGLLAEPAVSDTQIAFAYDRDVVGRPKREKSTSPDFARGVDPIRVRK